MKVIIIGGGPAGIIAAIKARNDGNEVIICEKMNCLGKKLLITGKGRCNITNNIAIDEFINYIPGNGKFLYSAFRKFDNRDIINLLEQNGVKTKVERGNRVFPVSNKSQDVLRCLIKILREKDVKIKINTKITNIIVEDGKAVGVETEDAQKIYADKVIIATGGKSYPKTGSTGDGYILAQKLGHSITKIKPSLVPLTIKEEGICKSLQGLSLRNIKICIVDNNKVIYEDFGEMLFTHFGVSGPIILSSSAILLRYKNFESSVANGKIKLVIDFKPALDTEKLDNRILRDFDEIKNKQYKNSMDKLLPQKLIPVIIERSKIKENKLVNEITKEERKKIVKSLKEFILTIDGFRSIDEAIVTAGGIKINEIEPKTMQSKIIKNLYFAGEVIDVDAYTGGFNLQIAYSTGYVAGSN